MRFLFFGLLLIAIRNSFAQNDISTILNNLGNSNSKECKKELERYEKCFYNFGSYNIDSLDKPETIQNFCSEFEEDKCSNYIKDITKSETACIKKDDINFMDLMAGIVNFSLKKTYLTYCGKGSDGKTCPYSQYVMDNVETNNSYNSTEIGDELKSVLEETCTNSKCYINLESIKKITDTLVEISNNGNSSNSTNKFYNVYSNLKCENIGSDDSSNITSLIRFSFSCIALIIVSTFILF